MHWNAHTYAEHRAPGAAGQFEERARGERQTAHAGKVSERVTDGLSCLPSRHLHYYACPRVIK